MAAPPLVLSRRPRRDRAVARPRLLDAAASAPLVVIEAHAGTGKSVAAGEIADGDDRTVGWCRLAPGYTDAVDLVGSAIRSLGGQPSELDSIVDLAGELLERLEVAPTTLVVDDYHHAEGDRCDVLLGEVVSLLPPESRIIVVGRTRPAGLLGRVGPTATVIGADDLAFTRDEARELFAARGRSAAAADAWLERHGGWATAVVIGAESAGNPEADTADLVALLLDDERLADLGPILVELASLPYLTADLAGAIRPGGADDLVRAGQLTSLVSESDGYWRLGADAGSVVLERSDPAVVASTRRAAAVALEPGDPGAAIDLHLRVGDHHRAADVLHANLSTVGPDRALRWLYELPADTRRRFPPSVSAGRATVNLDAAVVSARHRVDAAGDNDERREALLSLGSIHAGRGELADAADALDAAARASTAGSASAAAVNFQLGLARWWAGDTAGSRAALLLAGDTVLTAWVGGNLALAEGDIETVEALGARAVELAGSEPGATTAPGNSLQALAALTRGELDPAGELAASAYATALDHGGLDLAAAAVAHGWALARTGNLEEAAAVADTLQRRVGRQDMHARVQAALLRRELSRISGDTETRERDERRVRDLRALGY
ncbi:MAG: hypothetical protein OEU32_02305, partial [Acidimicrobiia bacterium]|nr:hypothetical protein [Acidimicrobiia bacterium]